MNKTQTHCNSTQSAQQKEKNNDILCQQINLFKLKLSN